MSVLLPFTPFLILYCFYISLYLLLISMALSLHSSVGYCSGVIRTVLPPHAEDLSAWAFPSPLSSPQLITNCCGSMRAQLIYPQVLSSISVSKGHDLWHWVIEWVHCNILYKLKSLPENFAIITEISTTFLLVLSQTVLDWYLHLNLW